MDTISIEQKAHDLTIAYVIHLLSQDNATAEPDDFVQAYNNAYPHILKAVKCNG